MSKLNKTPVTRAPATSGYTVIASLPKLNSARLTIENRAYQHPLCGLGNDRYLVLKGWQLVGWASAPYRGAGHHAIVYKRLTKDKDNVFDVGNLYWCHGDARRMQFCLKLPADLKDELGPWV